MGSFQIPLYPHSVPHFVTKNVTQNVPGKKMGSFQIPLYPHCVPHFVTVTLSQEKCYRKKKMGSGRISYINVRLGWGGK